MNWKIENRALVLGDRTVYEIAKEYGTPMYLYDLNIVKHRIAKLVNAFPGFKILYSIKANPNFEIAKLIANEGLGVEVASLGELELAISSGFSLTKIGIAGPAKTVPFLRRAVELNVDLISIESIKELKLLSTLNETRKEVRSVVIRININRNELNPLEMMAGTPSQFGIDEEILLSELEKEELKGIRINGIHIYAGSQILSAEALKKHFKLVFDIGERMSNSLPFRLERINFGGGFGIPYSPEAPPLNIENLGSEITESLGGTGIQPIIESGRFLVADSGIFLTEIIDVKSSRGETFVITNAGINGFARPAMSWANPHQCVIVSKMADHPTGKYKVVGPLCLPSDILAIDAELSNPQPGDILAFFNAGAYGFSMSPLLFLSHETPSEIVFDNGTCKVSRPNHCSFDAFYQPDNERIKYD